ncbi:PAS domain S-box protein [Maribellus maritimus]|uniref:PAS domain S-box protein n=1 Tax=Maribellus maritimus TaxID=2870838 RepID=UPI001EEBD719|nr:PAS domain S-box protein [Maribellus maritimus]MCG6186393.1 PAS domain S-box protein [Maribellus maritimus]
MNNSKSLPLTDNFFQFSNDLLCVADRGGHFVKINPEWERTLGYKAIDIEGKSYINFVHPDDLEKTSNTLEKLLKKGEEIDFVNRYKHKNGTYRWLHWHSFLEGDYFYASARNITVNKEKGDSLSDNEAVLRSTLEAMSDGILIVSNDGKVIHYNSQFKKIFLIPEEILLENDNKLIFESAKNRFNNPDQFLKKVKEIYQGNEVIKDIIDLKDGEIIERRSYPVYKQGYNAGRVWVFRDVTEKRNTEKNILKSEKKYRMLFENMTSAFALHKMIYDEKGDPVDYSYEEVNPLFERYINRPATSVIGKTAKELFPKIEDDWIISFAEVVKTGKPLNYIRYSNELNRYLETFVFRTEQNHFASIFNDVTERIHNKEILEKFKASIDYSLDAVFWINEESGFDYVNDQACRMLGYGREELMGLKIRDIDPVATDEIFKTIWETLHRNKKFKAFTVESMHKRKDGTTFPVELDSVFVWKDNKGLLISYAKDISERKEYEENLLKNQKLLNDSQKAGRIGSWEYSIEKDELVWNDQVYDIYGIDKSIKLNYKVFIDLIHPEDRAYLERKYKETIEQGIFSDYEYRIIRPDKTLCYVRTIGNIEYNENNKPYRTYGIVQDITPQKKNEENLELFKLISDYSTEGLYWIDPDANFVYANNGSCKMLGYSKEEFLLMKVFEIDHLYPEEEWNRHWKEYRNNRKEKILKIETVHIRKDGRPVNVEVVTSFFSNSNREFQIAHVRDITERKEYEEKILENQKLLNESQRIAKMGSWELQLENSSVHWSDSMYSLHGTDKHTFKLTHENFLKLVHPDDRQSVIKNMQRTYETGKIDNDEYRIIRPDGKVRTMVTSAEVLKNENNQPVKTIGVVQDITESKIAKEALVESEERARLFVENTPLPVALFDTNMCYIIASKQWYITYKVNDQDITGKYHYDLFPKTSDRWKDLHRQTLQGKVIKNEKDKFIRQDGSLQWVRYELHPWYKRNKTIGGMVAFTEDITEKVEAAEVLKETELKMQRIFEFAPVSIGLLDKRVIIDVNSQVCNLTWYEKEELIGKKTEFVFPSKKEYEKVGKVMYEQLKESGFGGLESKWKRKDGKLINVYLNLTYLNPEDPEKGVLFTALDITKQKEAEKQLINAKERAEESEFFLKESQSTGNIGSYKMDFKTGKWISTETLDNIFGISELYSKNIAGWLKIVHPDDRKRMDSYFQNEVIGKLHPFNKEYRIVRKADNEIRWLHGTGKLYFDNEGNLSHMQGIIQDITERKFIEEERRMMNVELEKRVKKRTAQLHQANKDLEAFAYSVSHDLRAPLRHINGFMHLLENAIGPANTKVQYYMDKISYSSGNMSSMIDELLKFSRLGRTDLKTRLVNLTTVINEIVIRLKPDYKGRNIQWNINELSEVYGDQGLLEIAFENLISNAIKYTAKKDQAIIEIGQKEDCQPENVCLFIKDNGAGFDMAYKDKLYGVFQRLHKSEEFDGIGIGLANAKQIITRHGGTIDAESEIDKGAIFYITLPIQKQK